VYLREVADGEPGRRVGTTTETPVHDRHDTFDFDGGIAAGLRISLLSLAWTVAAGAAAVAIGLASDSLVLIAFGALSLLDAAGSFALVVHFRHARKHERISTSHEALSLRVITVGMAVLGITTAGESVDHLISVSAGSANLAGIVLSAVSVVILTILGTTKRRIAPRIPSHALYSDGWLSTTGSLLALVTLAGTALFEIYSWWWLDPIASLVVALGAIGLSFWLARDGDD
jgi:divalent metal cation (Fe/Co/Zn/Cd) transporter